MRHLILIAASFFLGCTELSAQGGPTCNSALAVPITLPFIGSGLTNCGSVNDYDSGNIQDNCGEALYLGGEDHLYAFTALQNGTLTIDLTSTSTFVGLFLYSGCPDNGGTCLGSATGSGGNRTLTVQVLDGATYFVMVDSWPSPPCHPSYDLSVALAPGAPIPTEADCGGAISLCSGIWQGTLQTDEGAFDNEINENTSCLGSGETWGTWFSYSCQSDGPLCFTIHPDDPSSDFDWAVFDLTNSLCNSIYGTLAIEIACNFSGLQGSTGANGAGGGQNEPCLQVSAGDVLAMYVSNWSQDASGITLVLDSTSALVVDTMAPAPNIVVADPCSLGPIGLTFNDAVWCTSVQPTDIEITGPGGPYSITSLTSLDCDLNSTGASYFTLETNPALTAPGSYVLTLVDSVQDLCGNVATSGSAAFYIGDGIDATFTLSSDTLFLPDTTVSVFNTTPDAISCTWVQDTVVLSTDCSPVIDFPAFVGSYPVTLVVVDSAGCSDTLTQWLVIADTSSIGIAELVRNSMHLSPNPVSDVLAVEVSRTASNQVLQVVDVTGRTVLRTVTTGTRTLLDVHALKAGSYQVRVGDGMVGRFVKR